MTNIDLRRNGYYVVCRNSDLDDEFIVEVKDGYVWFIGSEVEEDLTDEMRKGLIFIKRLKIKYKK